MAEKLSLQQWLQAAEEEKKTFGAYCLAFQARDMEITEQAILERMLEVMQVMEESALAGIKGVKSMGGLVGQNASLMASYQERKERSLVGPIVSHAIRTALAVGEANAAMGRIVAAPTAGASGTLPAVLLALEEPLSLAKKDLARGLVVAGVIGMVIASRASLSGAAGGCQAECGSAAAMAAAAAVDLAGGTPRQVGQAVAMTIKNMLGLVCDPVAGLVEVPCVKRNAGAAAQALVAAEMAMAGVESVIPVDEVIDAMSSVGCAMSGTLRETAQGGLAVTPTGAAWQEKLFGKK